MKVFPISSNVSKFSILAGALALVPATTFAFVDPCQKIGGCSTNAQGLISLGIQNTAAVFISVAAGAAVLFVVTGGVQMLLSFGNDSMISKGRNSIIFALGGFALTLASQAIVSFVISRSISGGLAVASANPALALMRVAVDGMLSVFNAIFVVVAVGAGLRMIVGHGKSEEFTKAKTMLIYAVAGAVAINIAKALVNVILNAGF